MKHHCSFLNSRQLLKRNIITVPNQHCSPRPTRLEGHVTRPSVYTERALNQCNHQALQWLPPCCTDGNQEFPLTAWTTVCLWSMSEQKRLLCDALTRQMWGQTATENNIHFLQRQGNKEGETYLPFLGRFWMTSTAAWKRFWWSTTGSAIARTGMTSFLCGLAGGMTGDVERQPFSVFPQQHHKIFYMMINVTRGLKWPAGSKQELG